MVVFIDARSLTSLCPRTGQSRVSDVNQITIALLPSLSIGKYLSNYRPHRVGEGAPRRERARPVDHGSEASRQSCERDPTRFS